jgi:VIT1/CCC1 family predicted Fe2+/Mn2+ transporter
MRGLLREILKDELVHEDKVVVGQEEEKITPEFVRNLFLGLSDGLVEVLGAVSGFLASFENTSSVLLAGSIVALAGAMSMGAGTFVAVSSEREVEKIKIKKEEFLGNKFSLNSQSPLKQSFVVGFSYLLGALIPILPVALGMKSIMLVFLSSFVVLVFTSYAVSFLSGVKYRTHLFRSVAIITGITLITFAFSSFAKNVLGINL